jgi:hydroxylamine reductase
MFCYQCQETAGGKGCTVRGVCGKTEEVAKLQDLLIYTLKGISSIAVKGKSESAALEGLHYEMLNSLFMTITNANFDDIAIEKQIRKMLSLRDDLKTSVPVGELPDAVTFTVTSRESMLEKAAEVGVLSMKNEDIRSLKQMITYGVKGIAAYAEHAKNLGKEDPAVYAFIFEALAAMLDENLNADELVALTLKTGEYGVKVMRCWTRPIPPGSAIPK